MGWVSFWARPFLGRVTALRRTPYLPFLLTERKNSTFKAAPCHLCHLWGTQKNRLSKLVEMVPLDFLCDFLLGHRVPKSAPTSGYFDHFDTQNYPISLRHALECTQSPTFCIYHLPLKPHNKDGPKNCANQLYLSITIFNDFLFDEIDLTSLYY